MVMVGLTVVQVTVGVPGFSMMVIWPMVVMTVSWALERLVDTMNQIKKQMMNTVQKLNLKFILLHSHLHK